MPESGSCTDLLDNEIVLVDRWSQDAGNLELLSPGDVSRAQEVVQHLPTLIVSSLISCIVSLLNINENHRFFRQLHTVGLGLAKLNAERYSVGPFRLNILIIFLTIGHIDF